MSLQYLLPSILLVAALFSYGAGAEEYVQSPLKQISGGIAAEDVECRDGLVKVQRMQNGLPACVESSYVDVLVQIGWAKAFEPQKQTAEPKKAVQEEMRIIDMPLTECEMEMKEELESEGDEFLPIRFATKGNLLYVNGELNCATPDKFKKIISDNPQIDTLVLQYVPGSLDDEVNLPLSVWLRERGLDTYLESTSYIASGGVDLFLAGNSRIMENGARLGVHSWSDGETQAMDVPRSDPVHEIYVETMERLLGSDEFYWFTIFAAPAYSIHEMTNEEITRYGVVTEPIRGAVPPREITLYVAPELEDCVSLIEQKCLLIREDKNPKWEFLYEGIVGFDYKPGYEYKLLVKVTQIPNPPQDISSTKYSLVEVIEKSKPGAAKPAEQNPGIIVYDTPAWLSKFHPTHPKYTEVFGVHIVATPDTPDAKVVHAANVMAQYLDNDEDGKPDNSRVVGFMNLGGAVLVMANDPEGNERSGIFEGSLLDDHCAQDLYGEETNPADGFDASLEEVFHIITSCGYSEVYPDVFGEGPDSIVAAYMDRARGGHYEDPVGSYPADAWYTYDDPTCDYGCQVTEYLYWTMTSVLGAQEDRLGEIGDEWRLNTAQKMRDSDPGMYVLLTDPKYKLPTTLPDGDYDA